MIQYGTSAVLETCLGHVQPQIRYRSCDLTIPIRAILKITKRTRRSLPLSGLSCRTRTSSYIHTHQDVEVIIANLHGLGAPAASKWPLSKLPIPKHRSTFASPREYLRDTPLCLDDRRKGNKTQQQHFRGDNNLTAAQRAPAGAARHPVPTKPGHEAPAGRCGLQAADAGPSHWNEHTSDGGSEYRRGHTFIEAEARRVCGL